MNKKLNVTIWNEFRHEKSNDEVKKLYPDGIHAYLKSVLACDELNITLAALDDPDQGLPDEVLNATDVLVWWGHMAHHEVSDELVDRIRRRVYTGMGLVVLHSGHHSKVFRSVIGTTGNLCWGNNMPEIVWNINASHPIAAGIPTHFKLDAEELYAEPFQIPDPDEIVFLSWFNTGYVFRSGCCWKRGSGKIFYFQPGHETVPTYHNPTVQRIIKNALFWAAPADTGFAYKDSCPCVGGDFICDGELECFKK